MRLHGLGLRTRSPRPPTSTTLRAGSGTCHSARPMVGRLVCRRTNYTSGCAVALPGLVTSGAASVAQPAAVNLCGAFLPYMACLQAPETPQGLRRKYYYLRRNPSNHQRAGRNFLGGIHWAPHPGRALSGAALSDFSNTDRVRSTPAAAGDSCLQLLTRGRVVESEYTELSALNRTGYPDRGGVKNVHQLPGEGICLRATVKTRYLKQPSPGSGHPDGDPPMPSSLILIFCLHRRESPYLHSRPRRLAADHGLHHRRQREVVSNGGTQFGALLHPRRTTVQRVLGVLIGTAVAVVAPSSRLPPRRPTQIPTETTMSGEYLCQTERQDAVLPGQPLLQDRTDCDGPAASTGLSQPFGPLLLAALSQLVTMRIHFSRCQPEVLGTRLLAPEIERREGPRVDIPGQTPGQHTRRLMGDRAVPSNGPDRHRPLRLTQQGDIPAIQGLGPYGRTVQGHRPHYSHVKAPAVRLGTAQIGQKLRQRTGRSQQPRHEPLKRSLFRATSPTRQAARGAIRRRGFRAAALPFGRSTSLPTFQEAGTEPRARQALNSPPALAAPAHPRRGRGQQLDRVFHHGPGAVFFLTQPKYGCVELLTGHFWDPVDPLALTGRRRGHAGRPQMPPEAGTGPTANNRCPGTPAGDFGQGRQGGAYGADKFISHCLVWPPPWVAVKKFSP
ncbi:unnamed protein product [Trichogramma brassicae]|uniref:Uncharacterized protein n=1 Tax=Trichogramma brassicae TaxID=86971 RepID=A0A6H5HTF3_9HYME|nr:unnamed protein product [Trichogramma brassicae]